MILATAAFALAACGLPSASGTATPASEQTIVPMPASQVGSESAWFLMIPPRRAYAADRSTMMGGPLATGAGEGGEEHGAYVLRSIDQADTSAPLSKWEIFAGSFPTEADCQHYKATELADLNDPSWVAKQVQRARGRMIDLPAMRDMIEGQRCANSSEVSNKPLTAQHPAPSGGPAS